MRKEQATNPANEALELEEVKEYANINNKNNDDRLTALLQPAIDYVEAYTGKALIQRTYDIYYDSWELRSKMSLSTLNVTAINSFNTYDCDGTATLIDNTTYRLSGKKETYVIFDNGTNFSNTRKFDSGIINVTAGFGLESSNIDTRLRTALKMICTHWYRYNGAVADVDNRNIPHELKTQLIPYTSTENWIG